MNEAWRDEGERTSSSPCSSLHRLPLSLSPELSFVVQIVSVTVCVACLCFNATLFSEIWGSARPPLWRRRSGGAGDEPSTVKKTEPSHCHAFVAGCGVY